MERDPSQIDPVVKAADERIHAARLGAFAQFSEIIEKMIDDPSYQPEPIPYLQDLAVDTEDNDNPTTD